MWCNADDNTENRGERALNCYEMKSEAQRGLARSLAHLFGLRYSVVRQLVMHRHVPLYGV